MPQKYYMYDRIKIMKPLSKLLIVLTSFDTMIDMKNKTFLRVSLSTPYEYQNHDKGGQRSTLI